MIAEDVNHGSHGLFPLADAAGRFLMSLLVSDLFVTDFSLIGGVHTPHNMVLAPMERLALSAKPWVFIFCEGSGQLTSQHGWYLLICDALALSQGKAICLFLLGISLVAHPSLWRYTSSTSVGFLLALHSGHLGREGDFFASLLDYDPQMWLSMRDQSVYLYIANLRK